MRYLIIISIFLLSCKTNEKLPFHKGVVQDILKDVNSDGYVYDVISLDSAYQILFEYNYKEHNAGDTIYFRVKNNKIRIMKGK